MTISICLFFLIIQTKQYNQVIVLCSTLIVWLVCSFYNNFKQTQQNELVVFHVKHKSVFALRVGQRVYGNFNAINQNEFQRNVKPYLLSISNLKLIQSKSNFIKFDASIILNVNRNYFDCSALKANYIIVSNDVPFGLTSNFKTKPLVIADCSNSYKFVKELKKLCATLEVPFYSIKETGAIQINL
jgi:hypothetical protein